MRLECTNVASGSSDGNGVDLMSISPTRPPAEGKENLADGA